MENKSIQNQLLLIQNKIAEHDEKIILLFEYLKQLDQVNTSSKDHSKPKKIGFKRYDN